MNENPLEKVIEAKVVAFAKSKNCYVRKFTSPAHRSVPDRMLIAPNGTVYFIEFKRKSEKPTAAQAVEIEKIRKQKVEVFVVDDVEKGKEIVEFMLY